MRLFGLLDFFRKPVLPSAPSRAPGETDHAVLFSILADGQPRTLGELSRQTAIPTPTISARLRDFRKEGHVVDRFRSSKDAPWLYRLKPRHDLRDAATGRFAPLS